MKILYVARHGQANSNDDEGAIAHALRELGHEVVCLLERHGDQVNASDVDLLLFHKWDDSAAIARVKAKRKVFWYFDLVEHPAAPTRRCAARRAWMAKMVPLVDLGFCTDGDWVASHPDKLRWLPQGADERVTGRGHRRDGLRSKVLFAGSTSGREAWLADMHRKYGRGFAWINGVFGRDLADVVASADAVVAPPVPVTDRYWSNRVYVMLGFGAFLLHPRCEMLFNHYSPAELQYYSSQESMHVLLEAYLDNPKSPADDLRGIGLSVTMERHLYRHRCAELIKAVEEL